ncbi:MAG: endonuclease domain-containing protein [Micrococcales bacterium]|nr:endonuclease domain-containing protein [Micrococcales bacterium]
MAVQLCDVLAEHGPLSRSEIVGLGVGRGQFKEAAELRVHHGIYSDRASSLKLADAAKAALASCAQPALVSGLTALRLVGARIPWSIGHGEWTRSEPICLVAHSGGTRVRRAGIECHVTQQKLEPWRVVDEVPVAHPARSWLYMAATADVVSLVLLGDALLRRGDPLIRPSDLADVLDNPGCVRGNKKARSALRLIRPGTDSMGESWIRLKIIEAGLPCPDVNIVVKRDDNGSYYVVDLGYPELKIGIECDGPRHDDPDRVARDTERENHLRAMGWKLIRVNHSHYRDLANFIAALRETRAEAIALHRARF